MTRILLSGLAVSLAAGVALHEWRYYQDHPGRTGVSGVLVVLALAVGLAALGQLWAAWERYKAEAPERERRAEWNLRSKARRDAVEELAKLGEKESDLRQSYLSGEFELNSWGEHGWRYDEKLDEFLFFKPPSRVWGIVEGTIGWLFVLAIVLGPVLAAIGNALGWWSIDLSEDGGRPE